MSKEELIIIVESVNKEFQNLNKNKNRPRSTENVQEKTQKLVNLLKTYKIILTKLESSLSINEWNNECLKYAELKTTFQSCIKILKESKLIKNPNRFKLAVKSIINQNRLSKLIKMPTVDIKLGTALVQTYDGNPDNLNAFLDAVDLFKSTTETEFEAATPAQKQVAGETIFKFVKTRLTGVARQAIGGAIDLDQTLINLKEQCAPKINSDNIKAKLIALKQKGSLDDFCEQVQTLTQKLSNLYVEEKIPADKANQMATKSGVEALIGGISNHDTKLILKAGTFTKIVDAIQKLQENDNGEKSRSPNGMQAQVYIAKNNHFQRGRGRGRFTNDRGNFSSSYRQYSHPPRQINNGSSRFSNFRGNYSRGQNFNQRGQWSRGRGRYESSSYPSTYFMQPIQQTAQPVMQQSQQVPQPIYQQQQQQPIQNTNFLGTQFGRHLP